MLLNLSSNMAGVLYPRINKEFLGQIMFDFQTLQSFGWQPFFQQQITLDEWDQVKPARIIEVQRNQISILSNKQNRILTINPNWPAFAVGDWILLDESFQFIRLLDRQSVFKRKAAGSKVQEQLIASNIDTLFIVTSMNHDFNLNRMERYLSLAFEAQVEPVLVLTRADESDQVEELCLQASKLSSQVATVAINGLDSESVQQLHPWCQPGKTLAVMGSSGAGKSTLINSLAGTDLQSTGTIREDDSKGKHTTTSRSMHQLPIGGLIIDTPGMRELQLTDVHDGIEQTFEDITELAKHCRFKDCQHESEPGCAVQAAIASGELELRRLQSYKKLLREDLRNSSTLAERRLRDKEFGKMVKSVMKEKRNRNR